MMASAARGEDSDQREQAEAHGNLGTVRVESRKKNVLPSASVDARYSRQCVFWRRVSLLLGSIRGLVCYGLPCFARLARFITRAPRCILRLSRAHLSASVRHKLGVTNKTAQSPLARALELMTDTGDAIRVNAGDKLSTRDVLRIADGPLSRAIGRKFGITDELAEHFLQPALYLMADAFDTVGFHSSFFLVRR
jgi:hypothetical protein